MPSKKTSNNPKKKTGILCHASFNVWTNNYKFISCYLKCITIYENSLCHLIRQKILRVMRSVCCLLKTVVTQVVFEDIRVTFDGRWYEMDERGISLCGSGFFIFNPIFDKFGKTTMSDLFESSPVELNSGRLHTLDPKGDYFWFTKSQLMKVHNSSL